jgi:hypothetical protein
MIKEYLININRMELNGNTIKIPKEKTIINQCRASISAMEQ